MRSKWAEILDFMNSYDIVTFVETKIDPVSNIQFEHFVVNRCDRNNFGGGVLTAVSKKWFPVILDDLQTEAKCLNIEATFTLITEHISKEKIIIVGLYRPPNSGVIWFENVKSIILKALPIGTVILMGDLNANLLNNSNCNTRQVLDLLALIGVCESLPLWPTRITESTATCLDLIACPTKLNPSNYRVLNIAASDHLPVAVELEIHQRALTHTLKRVYSKNSENELRSKVEDIKLTKPSDATVDDLLDEWHSKVIAILDEVAPVKAVPARKSSCRWMTAEIKKLIKKRDYFVGKLRQQPQKSSHAEITNTVKDLRKQIKSKLRASAKAFGRESLHAGNSSKAWKYLKDITFLSKKSPTSEAVDSAKLNNYFASIVSDKEVNSPQPVQQCEISDSFSFEKISIEQTINLLSRVKA